jgi:hypothetical protein
MRPTASYRLILTFALAAAGAAGCSPQAPPQDTPGNVNGGAGGGGGFRPPPVGMPGNDARAFGSAFFVEAGGRTWAVTAYHLEETFGGPATRVVAGGVVIRLGEPLPPIGDVRWLPVTQGSPPTLPLAVNVVRRGDALLIRSARGEVNGRFASSDFFPSVSVSDPLVFTPSDPFDANGYSGSAVVLPGNSEVLGVVVAADEPGRATQLYFEPIIVPAAAENGP